MGLEPVTSRDVFCPNQQGGFAKVKRNGKPSSKAGKDFEYDQPTNDKDSGVSVRSFDGRRNQE